MATVGNYAAIQLLSAQAQTNYSYKTGNSASSATTTTKSSAQEQLDKLLDTTLKNKDSNFREKYTQLYKSIYGLTDETAQTADTTASLKTSAAQTKTNADALTSFAKKLEYGGEYNQDDYAKLAEKFADSYNSMVEGAGDSDSQSVLQKGVILVNTAKAYSSALSRAGFTLGSDNKLTFNKDKLSDVSATDIKTTFGTYGFSQKTAQKASQISSAAGSGYTYSTYNSARMTNYAYSIGALFSTYA